ncbi:phage antirepressor KilAC domain-containing protein, partial [Clostridium culturomicium]
KGKQARQYFIQVEKDWNSPDKIMERALIIARARVEKLTLETKQQKQIIGELKPKADYTDTILKNKGLVTITQIAKDYGMSGQAFNKLLHELGVQYKQSDQWLLYSEHHSKGYTHSETVPITRSNGTPDVKMVTKWTQKGRLFLYDLLKQHEILPTIEREE